MRFLAYFIGALILIAGLAWAAITAGVPELWVAIGAVILLGLSIMSAVTNSRRRATSGDVTVVHDRDPL